MDIIIFDKSYISTLQAEVDKATPAPTPAATQATAAPTTQRKMPAFLMGKRQLDQTTTAQKGEQHITKKVKAEVIPSKSPATQFTLDRSSNSYVASSSSPKKVLSPINENKENSANSLIDL